MLLRVVDRYVGVPILDRHVARIGGVDASKNDISKKEFSCLAFGCCNGVHDELQCVGGKDL